MSRQDQASAPGRRNADKYKSLHATRADPRQRQMIVAHTIRKNKRAETLTKRRMLIYHEATGGGGAAGVDGCDADAERALHLNIRDGEDAAVLLRMLADDANVSDQLLAVVHLRKLLTTPEEFLDDVMALDEGLVGKLLEMVAERDDRPRIQFEAAWVLTNLLSGAREPTLKIVDAGAVRVFVRKIESSSNVQLIDQCVWAIGNVVGDGAALRDVCIAEGGLDALCGAIVANHENEAFLRNATWALGHFFIGDPRAGRDVLEPVLDVLEQLLQCDDIAVVSDAAWAVAHYTEGNDDACNDRIIDVATRPNVVARLSQLLVTDTTNQAITTPALRVLGNLITHPDEKCTDAVLDTDPLPALLVLLAGGEKNARKEVCWMLSNVAAGSARQVAALLETDGLMARIVSAMCSDVHDVKTNAAWCVCNTTVGASDEQIREFVTPNVFEGLFACMHAALAGDEALLLTILMAISNIMRASRGAVELNLTETYVDQIRNHLEDAVELIVALQDHPAADVAAEAEYLVERWFHDADDDSDDSDDTAATTSSSDPDEDSEEGDIDTPASSSVPLDDDDAAATAPAPPSGFAWKF